MTKVTCPKCGKFCGFIQDDGTGPWADDCLDKQTAQGACPMLPMFAENAPHKIKGYDLGSNTGPVDEDAGSYRSNAVRALEDAE